MAQLKNTTFNDTGSLALPAGTTAQRPGTPAAGMIRYNTTVSDTEYYDGAAWRSISDSNPEATGGTIVDTDIGGVAYRIHLFTTVGNSTFTVTKGGEVEYLIVGGGGSGGNDHGGGGGGGGLIQGTTTVTPQVYTITVGAGAASAPAVRNNTTSRGTNGGTSSAFGVTALGGGGGGGSNGSTSSNGRSGGSGGGSSGFGSPRTPGLGTSGQGNNGGTGGNNAPDYQGAGGGGAGAQGANGANPGVNSYGGTGIASSISGNLQFYGGGGGGSSSYQSSNGAYGSGGAGGGGHGATNNLTPIIPLSPAKSGVPNTGGGGGGANRYAAGGSQHLGPSIGPSGSGGSGIVIIRYPLRQANPVVAAGRVVGDGLVLDLDFAKPTVYTGSGTVVNDSRLNGVTGTLVNGPAYTDGATHRASFVFTGSQTITISSNPLTKSQSTLTQDWTVSAWIRIDTTTSQTLLNLGIGLYPVYGVNNSLLYMNSGANDYYTYGGNFGGVGWTLITFRFNNSSNLRSIWRDGANVTTGGPNRASTPLALPSSLTIGSSLRGNLATLQMYNRYITDAEVIQYYNATRWRFGV